MAETIKESFAAIDRLIRNGEGGLAAVRLKAMRTRPLGAADRAEYASLARRLSLPGLALRLLNPIVRPQGRMRGQATDQEKAEYAAALIKIGAHAEALEILDGLSNSSESSPLLFRAFAHIGQWNYAAAIPFLRRYIESTEISHYQRLVGMANLCEALVYSEDKKAGEVIENALSETKAFSYTIIHGHVQLTQIYFLFLSGDLKNAEVALVKAEEAFRENNTIETFFVRKWTAILTLFKSKNRNESLRALDSVRQEAIEKWQHWETVRDCDFYQALHTDDKELLLHLYHGTPFESFRRRLLNHNAGLESQISKTFLLKLPRIGAPTKTFNLFSGDGALRKALHKSGKLNARLLSLLVCDFYRPQRVATLAAQLYPGEFFNPVSSPLRVRLAVHRLRQWLKQQKLPLKVEEISGSYRLEAIDPLALVLPHSDTASPLHPELDLLRSSLTNIDRFSVHDVCKALSISVRSANRLLKEAEELGFLQRKGKGRSTHYSWKNSPPASSLAA